MQFPIKIGFLFLIFMFLVPSLVLAQDLVKEVDVTGQIRVRSQMDDKDFNSDTDPYDFSELRTRLNIKAKFGDKVCAFVQLQDSRKAANEDHHLVKTSDL